MSLNKAELKKDETIGTSAEALVRLCFVVWCPTEWGDEVCVVRGTDLATSFPCVHSGKESWWNGSLTLPAVRSNNPYATSQILCIEMPFHIIKRHADGTVQWETGEEHRLQINVLSKHPVVQVVCAFRGFERAPRSGHGSWGNWPAPYGPGVAAQRASGEHFVKADDNNSSLFVELLTRANYYQPHLRIVGDIPELGAWDAAKAVPLTYSFVTQLYSGKVEWDKTLGPRTFTYKVVATLPTHTVWESGDNRTCFIDPELKEGKPTLAILDVWGVDLDTR